MTDEKDLDLVVFGATGFTGRRAVRHLTGHAPTDLRWAVAGRDRVALERLGAGVPILVADVTDPAGLASVVARTRVVLNMAGPFRRLGDPVVAACIEHSAHYCDISGETARIRDLLDRHQETAERAGVKIVCFAGASSAPADLAVLLLGPQGRQPTPRERDPIGVWCDRARRAWMTRSPLGVSDTRAIRLSVALRGSDPEVQEYLAFDGLTGVLPALAIRVALTAVGTALRTRPGRAVLTRIAPPGAGPSERQVDGGSYRLDTTGTGADGRRARVTMGFDGDPGNYVTALCAAETALALGGPGQPGRTGVLTPSTAVGGDLVSRLVRVGMRLTRMRTPDETDSNESRP